MSNFKNDHNQDSTSRNLILVSNTSQYFNDNLLYNFSRNSSQGGFDIMRNNSSVNNLFGGFQQQPKIKEQKPKIQYVLSDSQKYAKECLQYEKYIYDDKVKLIIHRMAILSYLTNKDKDDHPFLSFFVQRLLTTLAKKLLLNRFELLFLQYVLEQSKWKYESQLIYDCANQFKPFMHVTESQNPNGIVKNVQAYLLFCAYYSKKSLNDIVNESMFNYFLKTISDKFKQKYNQWSDQSGIKRIVISPKLLNSIFRKVTSFNQREIQYIQNYNSIVQQILDISPAYNADKEGKTKRKKIKKQEVVEREPQKQQESNQNLQAFPLNDQQQSNDFPRLIRHQTSFISNVDGLDPLAQYNRNL